MARSAAAVLTLLGIGLFGSFAALRTVTMDKVAHRRLKPRAAGTDRGYGGSPHKILEQQGR